MKVTIVGAGPAGRYAAITAAENGAEVTLIDAKGEDGVGGKCLPKGATAVSALVEVTRIVVSSRRIPGVEEPDVDPEEVLEGVRTVVSKIHAALLEEVRALDVEVVKDEVLKVREGPVLEAERGEYEADAVVVCTGSEPVVPEAEGVEGDAVLPVTELAYVDVPSRAAVVGDEPFALEAAYALAGLGVDATVLSVENPLKGFPSRLRSRALEDLAEVGVEVERLGSPESFRDTAEGVKVIGSEGSHGPFDVVFLALGFRPRSEVARRSGIETDGRDAVVVDDRMRTSMEDVYAAGDVTGPPYLTSVARYEGVVAALNAVGIETRSRDVPVPRTVRLSRDHCVIDGVKVPDSEGPTPAGGPAFWFLTSGAPGRFEIEGGRASVSAPYVSVVLPYLPRVEPSGDWLGVHPTTDPFPEVLRELGLGREAD